MLLVGGLLIGLVLLEVALQAAAAYMAYTRPHDPHWLQGGQRIVCMGDSNTFGMFLERPAAQAYPHQVQEIWNAQRDSSIEVLNLGVPGTNSSKIRSTLPEILRTLHPDTVFVMVGVNDFWISPVPDDAAKSEVSWMDGLQNRSRVFRLFHIISRATQQQALDISLPKIGEEKTPEAILHYGGRDIDLTPPAIGGKRKQWREDLYANLLAIVEQARRASVRLILLTYPSEGTLYNQANAAIRRAAETSGTPLIDLGTDFLEICPSKDPKICDDLFYFDYHPRLRGHEIAARIIVDRLAGGDTVTARSASAEMTP